jgi:DNA repair protein RecO (recombination protein O)
MTQKREGIVLKAIEHRDNAQIISLLTDEGLDSVIVRGALKPESKTRLLTGLFNLISYSKTSNKDLNTLTEGLIITSFPKIRQDYDRLQAAFCIIEKLYAFHDAVTDKAQLYHFALSILKMLEETAYPNVCLLLFEVKLFFLLGIGPNFSSCTACGKSTSEGYFNVAEGGIVCEECHVTTGYDCSPELTTLLKYLYLIRLEKVNDDFFAYYNDYFKELGRMVDWYYEQHLGFRSISKKVIQRAAE